MGNLTDRLFKSLGIFPDREPAGEREEGRLQELEEADEAQREKLHIAAEELKKPSVRGMSEEQFQRMLENLEGEWGGSDDKRGG